MRSSAATNGSRTSCCRRWKKSGSSARRICARPRRSWRPRGAHPEFGLAKRLVRLGKYLATTGTIYRPKALLAPDTPKATLATYYQSLWDKLLPKWKDKADLKDVFAPEHPLGQWRDMAKELYALELRLPQQRAAPPTPARQLHKGAAPARWELRDWDRAGLVGSFTDYRSAWQQALSVLGRNTSRTAPVRFKIATPTRGLGRKLLKDTSIRLACLRGKYRRRPQP